jgi:hypothetical protein
LRLPRRVRRRKLGRWAAGCELQAAKAAPPPSLLAPPKSPDLDLSLLEACMSHDRNVTAMRVHETCVGSVFVAWFMVVDVSVLGGCGGIKIR